MDNKDENINPSFPDLDQETEPVADSQPQEDAPETKPEDSQLDASDDAQEQIQPEPETKASKIEKPKKKKKAPLIILLALFILAAGTAIFITVYSLTGPSDDNQYSVIDEKNEDIEEDEGEEKPKKKKIEKLDIAIKSNDIDDFDLAFLKIEDDGENNIVYSPLSIKYALTMLNEGAVGESKAQIDKVLGAYHFKSYTNSANLSLANALFVNSTKKDKIKEAYSSSLNTNFNAELIYDDFTSPDNINTWVSNKTFDLVKDILKADDLDPDYSYFALVNALAIDMEWVNELQLTKETAEKTGKKPYDAVLKYERGENYDTVGENIGYYEDKYGSMIGAVANKYDIIKELGEDKIRSTIQEEYEKWAEKMKDLCTAERIEADKPNLDEYVNTLSQYYGYFNTSTDFSFYDDDDVRAFAKDLKTYDNTTLQYISFEPKNKELSEFIDDLSAEDLNIIIKNLKNVEPNNFKEGVVTEITGIIFNFDYGYNLNLKDDFEVLGIKDVFSPIDADLTSITDDSGIGKQDPEHNVHITTAKHEADIALSNSGIKAGAATALIGGGLGAGPHCYDFNYAFEVPVEKIGLNFYDNYLFLIRDKDSGEIWFAGAVYEPKPVEE